MKLRQKRRIDESILGVGKGRVWMDPNEVNEIALANSRKSVRKLIKDNFILKKKIAMHSRQRARLRKEERRLGRHTGLGKRRGCADGRMPQKILWIRRQRTLRRLLKKYRSAEKIDKKLYHKLYLDCKASRYNSKRNLADGVEKIIAKKKLEQKLVEQKKAKTDQKDKKDKNKKEKDKKENKVKQTK